MGLRQPGAARSDLRYHRGNLPLVGPQGLPLVKPPYARLTAIDLGRGEIAWQVPLGDGPRDHPALRELGLPPLGAHRLASFAPGWPLVTKTLLFVAQAVARERGGSGIGYLRAFDKATGELVWETTTEIAIQGAPMTYVLGGRQYVVAPIGGRNNAAELRAWTLQ
jgi:quinoprotein glucose dehydrogenase